jgi:hypothetical protein
MKVTLCPTCQQACADCMQPLRTFAYCPSCGGRKGGSSRSAKKQEASHRNIQQTPLLRQKRRRERRERIVVVKPLFPRWCRDRLREGQVLSAFQLPEAALSRGDKAVKAERARPPGLELGLQALDDPADRALRRRCSARMRMTATSRPQVQQARVWRGRPAASSQIGSVTE